MNRLHVDCYAPYLPTNSCLFENFDYKAQFHALFHFLLSSIYLFDLFKRRLPGLSLCRNTSFLPSFLHSAFPPLTTDPIPDKIKKRMQPLHAFYFVLSFIISLGAITIMAVPISTSTATAAAAAVIITTSEPQKREEWSRSSILLSCDSDWDVSCNNLPSSLPAFFSSFLPAWNQCPHRNSFWLNQHLIHS